MLNDWIYNVLYYSIDNNKNKNKNTCVCCNDENKALSVEFGNCYVDKHEIFSSGTDCIVKQFLF